MFVLFYKDKNKQWKSLRDYKDRHSAERHAKLLMMANEATEYEIKVQSTIDSHTGV